MDGWVEQAKKHPVVTALGAAVAVMIGVSAVREFVEVDMPWLASFLGPAADLVRRYADLVVTGAVVFLVVVTLVRTKRAEDRMRAELAKRGIDLDEVVARAQAGKGTRAQAARRSREEAARARRL